MSVYSTPQPRNPNVADLNAADPPAGVDQTLTVPAGLWQVIGIFFRINCSAQAANRLVTLTIQNQLASVFMTQLLPVTLVASQSGRCFFGSGMPITSVADGTTIRTIGSLPVPLLLQGGDLISTFTNNMQSSDQITQFMVRLQQVG